MTEKKKLGSIWCKLLREALSGISGRKKNVILTWAVYMLNSPLLLILRHLWHLHWADVAQNGVTPFHTIESVSLQLLAWAAFTIPVSQSDLCILFSKCYLLVSPVELLSNTACSFTFYTSKPNVFHFVLASAFLHSWMTTRGMVPEEAFLTSYLHVITGGHSTSIPAKPEMQQWWKTCPEVGPLHMFAQAGLWFVTVISHAYYDDT